MENFEKKYKEAVERLMPYFRGNGDMTPTKELLVSIFPELAESEDEKIRQLLIRFVKYDMGDNYSDDFTPEDCIAWLEKQGEQKFVEWSEEDELFLDNAISACLENYGENSDTAEWLKSLRPQKQWKPSEEQMRVLDLAIRCGINRGTTEETTLVSLFNDLKKQKGE